MCYEQAKQILANSFLFVTFTGTIHYFISKFLEDSDSDSDSDSNNNNSESEQKNDNFEIENMTIDDTEKEKKINNISEKTISLIKKKEELEDLYIKLMEIKSKIMTIKNNKN
jgi:hypothetical protein